MAFGVRIFDSSGVDLTGTFTPIFFLEAVSDNSGSRNYGSPPAGKSLKFLSSSIESPTSGLSSPAVTVSGGSASWSNNPVFGRIIFYWG